MTSKRTEALPLGGALNANDELHLVQGVVRDGAGNLVAQGNSRRHPLGTLATFFAAAATGTAAILESVRDMLGSGGLTAGNGLTATFDDPGDTLALSVNFASASEIRAGDVANKSIAPGPLFDAMDEVALADGATITPDFGAGINFTLTIGGNRTLANPTNAEDGMSGVIIVTQDATGGRTLDYGNAWRFSGGKLSSGVLSAPAGSVDLISYVVISGLVYANIGKGFAA